MFDFQMKARNMNPQDVQGYLNKLRSGEGLPEGAGELERVAMGNYLQIANAVQQIDAAITNMEKERASLERSLEKARADMNSATGEMAGYAKLLVAAEDARRAPNKAPPADPPPAGVHPIAAAAELAGRKLKLEADGEVIPAAKNGDGEKLPAKPGVVVVEDQVKVPAAGAREDAPQN